MQRQRLDAYKAPLNNLNLIEASAGTGKTYTIENLFARLIIQQGQAVDRILTVTFTEAATSELKDRIRNLLQSVAIVLQGNQAPDKLPCRLEQLAYGGGEIDLDQRRKAVHQAIHNFDEAAIHTIHGFCGRILYEYAFETGTLFNTELAGESEDLIQEIVNDFFRVHFYSVDRFTESVLHALQINPLSLFKFVREYHKRYAADLQPAKPAEIGLAECRSVFEQLQQTWDREKLVDLLQHHQLSRRKYKPEQIEQAADDTERFLDGDFSSGKLAALQAFSASQLKKYTNKGGTTPRHDFFNICDTFLREFEKLAQYKVWVYHRLIAYFQNAFMERKRQRNIHTFDDLLKKLHTALYTGQNPSLVKRIRARFNVVLIDEFQDTDVLQYAIFKKIFIEGHKTTFLVGDPKQAIYRFRGADVHVYHQARRELESRKGRLYTLNRNYRATPNYINSINQVFANHRRQPFASPYIGYYPAEDNEFDKQVDLTCQGQQIKQPIRLFYLDRSVKVPQLEHFACQQTVREIFRLLTDSSYQFGIQKRYIIPSDIAILVDKHQQAHSLQPYLEEFNIPYVLQATGNIFDSLEAEELALLLHALAEPNNFRILKGALATHFFDLDAAQLYLFEQDPQGAERENMEQWISLFRTCQILWEKHSFLEMFNHFLSRAGIKNVLLCQPQGERRVTNLLHLIELLQQAELEQSLSMTGLITWFTKQRNPDTRESKDEYEIRLETDAKAVKIITVHKSKGLEFPIVFCPFLWSRDARSGLNKSDHYEFHDSQGQYIFDLSKAEENRELAADENLEELLRLAYVALTRGNYLCYLVWGHILKKTTSALDYLSCADQNLPKKSQSRSESNTQLSKTLETVLKSHKGDTKFRLRQLQNNYPLVKIQPSLDEPKPAGEYIQSSEKYQPVEPEFKGYINRDWGILSFSSLVTQEEVSVAAFEPDYDAYVDPESTPELESAQTLSIFNFPAGKRTGNCWHHIFEELEFTSNPEEIKQVVYDNLTAFHLTRETEPTDYREQKRRVTLQMVKNVLTTPLLDSDPDLRLDKIASQHCLAEKEFNFPIDDLKIAAITELLRKQGYQLKLSSQMVSGFLNGFIDLVFRFRQKWYLVDWKSNQITGTQAGFTQAQLQAEMDRHHYALQYLIYTVALQRYLQQHIKDYHYDQHFGGIFYLFLRGIDPAHPGRGIYCARPDHQLIGALDQEMGSG